MISLRLTGTLLLAFAAACTLPDATFYDVDGTAEADAHFDGALAVAQNPDAADTGLLDTAADDSSLDEPTPTDAARDQGAPPDASCAPLCADGERCGVNGNCASGQCGGGLCRPPGCAPRCNDSARCGANGDCGSLVCSGGRCQRPACAPACASASPCGQNTDCASRQCTAAVCR